jgi:hypothetical protein
MENEKSLAVIEGGAIEPSKEGSTEKPMPSVHLVARNPQQMAAAQADLTAWLQNKRSSVLADIHELETARDEAKRHKWKTSSFTNAICKFRKQHDFYQKILEAVIAGYTIVPNFPIDIFAIRVNRTWAATPEQYGGGSRASYLAETPDILPAGEGEYKSPKPDGFHYTRDEKQGDKVTTKHYFASTNMQDCEFPFTVARPEIMTATAEAMALRVFDQIGICPKENSRRGKGDPLIIGQIAMSVGTYGYALKAVNFLIAWHLDLRTL